MKAYTLKGECQWYSILPVRNHQALMMLKHQAIYRLKHAWPWMFAIKLCAQHTHRGSEQKKRQANRNRMKMNCVLDSCVCHCHYHCLRLCICSCIYMSVNCAFTALSTRRTKSVRRSDLWLWYRFELHSKHNSTFSYYIVHFLLPFRLLCCLLLLLILRFHLRRSSFFFSSAILVCTFFSSCFSFSFNFSILWSFFIVISFRFHFIRLFAYFFLTLRCVSFQFYFCLQTAHKLFCECEPNERKANRNDTSEKQNTKKCQLIGVGTVYTR